MKRLCLLLCFILCISQGSAQVPKLTVVKNVQEVEVDLDARAYFPRHDFNDRLCALIKVSVTGKLNSPLTLEVGGLGVVARVEKASGEVWFYVPAQVKNLNFGCAGYEAPAAIPVSFKEGVVYRITLNVNQSQPTISNNLSAERGEHLVFRGVPIDGTLNQYVKEMQRAGFRLLDGGGGAAILQGDFAGFKKCALRVSTVSNHDLVCTIDVFFSDREKWGELYNDYSTLKSMLTQKYGKPSSCVESFQDLHNDDDWGRVLRVKMKKCKYITTFTTPRGTIILRIDNANFKCFVSLTYSDKINSLLVRNTAIDDL